MLHSLVPLLFSTPLFASPAKPIDLAFTAKTGSREISAPHLLVRPGETTRLAHTDELGTTIREIKIKDAGHGPITVECKVTDIDSDGHSSEVGNPRITALENEPANISVAQRNKETGAETVSMSMSVVAKRLNAR